MQCQPTMRAQVAPIAQWYALMAQLQFIVKNLMTKAQKLTKA
jgi:hypothetical protein